jgi:S-DNA-T family DNA segregation ATPase FtsK/SpoIIIE
MSSANRIVEYMLPFVSDNEIEKINNSLRTQAEPDYVDEILNFADEKETQEIIKVKVIKMNFINQH